MAKLFFVCCCFIIISYTYSLAIDEDIVFGIEDADLYDSDDQDAKQGKGQEKIFNVDWFKIVIGVLLLVAIIPLCCCVCLCAYLCLKEDNFQRNSLLIPLKDQYTEPSSVINSPNHLWKARRLRSHQGPVLAAPK
ncbi:unnamed protein product [Blepharisma stoltei]|uniref:Transmembrane protein n=1 Tax=Blepharisma stoltei TaxID=1481888 RepID=A0AAU9JUU9_9CILI|nr:unnamed protein product [Blepharisma stoltei]